jgi:hypothetical protein
VCACIAECPDKEFRREIQCLETFKNNPLFCHIEEYFWTPSARDNLVLIMREYACDLYSVGAPLPRPYSHVARLSTWDWGRAGGLSENPATRPPPHTGGALGVGGTHRCGKK